MRTVPVRAILAVVLDALRAEWESLLPLRLVSTYVAFLSRGVKQYPTFRTDTNFQLRLAVGAGNMDVVHVVIAMQAAYPAPVVADGPIASTRPTPLLHRLLPRIAAIGVADLLAGGAGRLCQFRYPPLKCAGLRGFVWRAVPRRLQRLQVLGGLYPHWVLRLGLP
jgi:hypothetical protein